MPRNIFGWDLPPGVTNRMIDEAAGAFVDDEPEPDGFDEPPEETCQHEWVENGDEQHHGEGRIYCMWCGADGDA